MLTTPGTYKWTDIILSPSGFISPADRADVRLIDDVVLDFSGEPTENRGNLNVTWDITVDPNATDFEFTLDSYSNNAAGIYL